MAKVSRIYLGIPAPPAERQCDFCERTAATSHEIFKPRKKVGTGQFLYACPRHRRVAEEAIDQKRNPPKAAA